MSKIVATFAGDSGDGVQLLGNAFSELIAQLMYNYSTLPDFPAEIRAPAGTIHGVSGFQIQWGNESVETAGHSSDILIVFNAAGLKKYRSSLKKTGLLIYDPAGFDAKNCKLSNFDISELETFPQQKLSVDFSALTLSGLNDFEMSIKDKDKNKNIFALGYLIYGIGGNLETTKTLLKSKFKENSPSLEIILTSLSQGYNYGDITEFSFEKITSEPSISKKGVFKNITGNLGIVYALLAAPKIFGRNLFFGGYPITPASEILHELSKLNVKEIIVRQAEDEISAASMAIGASYGGLIGVTASSGPGIDLKQEAIGLAHMAELPLLIIDVQRAGPSTGMPTKVEQSDLNVSLFGRHGDTPIPVVSISNPAKAYETTLKAIEIMIQFQTPIFLLSDSVVANGSELWEIPEIKEENFIHETAFQRDNNMVKSWGFPGKENKMFIIGGLEKDFNTGTISYDGENHQKMNLVRTQKLKNISAKLPDLKLEKHSKSSDALIISWGSTKGVISEALKELNSVNSNRGFAHLHLDWIYPLPANFQKIIAPFSLLVIPELNNGQLANYLASLTSKKIHKINKTHGLPFYSEDLMRDFLNI